MITPPTLRLFDGYHHTTPHLAPDVERLQTLLGIGDDGRFGPFTEKAVELFQGGRSLKPDGIVGPITWSALLGKSTPSTGVFDTTYSIGNPSLSRQLAVSRKHTATITAGALAASVPVAVVWAIGSRESHWGLALNPPGPEGTGDYGHGRGLMQIDDRWHDFARGDNWRDPEKNILYGCEVLRDNVRTFQTIARSQWLRAALAAYNCGAGNVRKAITAGRDVDYYTAGRNYSADVLSRAGWYQRQLETRE